MLLYLFANDMLLFLFPNDMLFFLQMTCYCFCFLMICYCFCFAVVPLGRMVNVRRVYSDEDKRKILAALLRKTKPNVLSDGVTKEVAAQFMAEQGREEKMGAGEEKEGGGLPLVQLPWGRGGGSNHAAAAQETRGEKASACAWESRRRGRRRVHGLDR